jgi:hypothetical protein
MDIFCAYSSVSEKLTHVGVNPELEHVVELVVSSKNRWWEEKCAGQVEELEIIYI